MAVLASLLLARSNARCAALEIVERTSPALILGELGADRVVFGVGVGRLVLAVERGMLFDAARSTDLLMESRIFDALGIERDEERLGVDFEADFGVDLVTGCLAFDGALFTLGVDGALAERLLGARLGLSRVGFSRGVRAGFADFADPDFPGGFAVSCDSESVNAKHKLAIVSKRSIGFLPVNSRRPCRIPVFVRQNLT